MMNMLNAQIGDVFVAHSDNQPGTYWRMEVVGLMHWGKDLFFVCHKRDTGPDTTQAVVFDQNGAMAEEDCIWEFHIVRKSRCLSRFADDHS